MSLSRRTLLASAAASAVYTAASALGQNPLAPPDRQPPDLKVPEPRRRVGFAVVGLGALALEEIMPAFGLTQQCRPVALVSGHREKAARVAQAYGIEPGNLYSYENFDTIKDNPAIDVVYIVLPNSMHAEYTVRALRAGKHVLCEKPMATSVRECQQMIEAAEAAKRKLMIAYRLHYEPHHLRAMEMMSKGEIGRPRVLESHNCQNTKVPNIRLSKATGGGPVSDVGIYSINAARYLLKEEPQAVCAVATSPADDDRFREVPGHVSFLMRYASGVQAMCVCGFDSVRSDRLRVVGDEGYLEIDSSFGYRNQKVTVFKEGRRSELQIEPKNHFTCEMDDFASVVVNNTETRTPGELGLKDVRIVEKIKESYEAEGKWVDV